ncbi:nucleotide exchange factor GrpE [Thermodesulfobacteriota bacterium]
MNEKSEAVKVHIKGPGPAKAAEKDNKEQEISEKPLEKMVKPELIEKAEEFQAESARNYDLYLRSQAEMENLRKRAQKDKEEWIKFSNEALIKNLLGVMDNLEKAIEHSQNDNSLQALREGIELTLKGLQDTLKKSGLEAVKAEGEPFDPCFHEAVSQLEDDDSEAGTILQELQKGYVLNERLIRPAMVVVNKGKPADSNLVKETPNGAECENE